MLVSGPPYLLVLSTPKTIWAIIPFLRRAQSRLITATDYSVTHYATPRGLYTLIALERDV